MEITKLTHIIKKTSHMSQ